MASEQLLSLTHLFDHGGNILWLLMFLSVCMWTILMDRFLYLFIIYPAQIRRSNKHGESFDERTVPPLRQALSRGFPIIRTLVNVLPLIGLLGTVVGMEDTFHALTLFGNRNPQGLSQGISQALLTTVAGLLTSLSGLIALSRLEKQSHKELNQLKLKLRSLEPMAISPLLRLRSQQRP